MGTWIEKIISETALMHLYHLIPLQVCNQHLSNKSTDVFNY